MKIFGTTDVQGLLKANTGSFLKTFKRTPQATPNVLVAGSDATVNESVPGNRSVVGHGMFDYIIASSDSGNTITQGKVLAGRNIGYRIQHVDAQTVYSLTMEEDTNAIAPIPTASAINISFDGGANFSRFSILPDNFNAFDMRWVSQYECYVVGATTTPYAGGGNYGTKHWRKFNHLIGARGLTTLNVNKASATSEPQVTPAVYKITKTNPSDLLPADITSVTLTGDIITNGIDVITAVGINPSNSNIRIYGTERGRIYKDVNGTTTQVTSGISSGLGIINRIVFSPFDSNVVFLCSGIPYGEILKSEDGGDTWTSCTINGLARYNGGINDIAIPKSNLILAVGDTYTSILRSYNTNGDSFDRVLSGIPSKRTPIKQVKTLNITDNDPNTVDQVVYAALSDDDIFWDTKGPFSLSNPDASRNVWESAFKKGQRISPGQSYKAIDLYQASDGKARGMVVWQQTAQTAYLNEVGITDNSGRTFEVSFPMAYNSYNLDFNAISVRNENEVYVSVDGITAGSGGYVFKCVRAASTDIFTVDRDTDSANAFLDVKCTTNKVFACGEAGLLKYKTYGDASWTNLTSALGLASHRILKVRPIDDSNIFVLTTNNNTLTSHVYKSTDGGSTWSEIRGLFRKSVDLYVVDINNIYVLHDNGFSIEVSLDGGSVWTVLEDPNLFLFGNVALSIDTTKPYGAPEGFVLTCGIQGVILSDLSSGAVIGPWDDTPISLVGISGEGDYTYWVGGGTTFNPERDYNTEPYLLKSTDNGIVWTDVSAQIINLGQNPSEPELGDFIITSLSEGSYQVYKDFDKFYIYSSDDSGTSFQQKSDSNVFSEVKKYLNGTDGILKLRFYDSDTGFAVGTIKPSSTDPSIKLLSYTTDGGATWTTSATPAGYNITSVFFTSVSVGYITAYPVNNTGAPDYNKNSAIFKTTDGGITWSLNYSIPSGKSRKPLDIYFITDQIGIFTVYGGTGVEGIYRTTNAGSSWSFVTITGYRGGNTKHPFMDDKSGQIQFVSTTRGFISGKYQTTGPALFTTTDAGATWTRVSTPINAQTDNSNIDAFHFLNTSNTYGQTGVFSLANKIYRTTNGGANATLVYTIPGTNPTGTAISDIKFSKDNSLGIAVGSRKINDFNDHFVLKSINQGTTWSEVDSAHIQIDLENKINPANSTQRDSILYTTAFLEQLSLLTEDSGSNGNDDTGSLSEDCTDFRFLSASFYNLKNFAYKCSLPNTTPVYVPNTSQNIGLGEGIFGQLTSTPLTTLRDSLTQGAALGVSSLGNTVYSNKDTAVGYQAMGQVPNAKENVAVGVSALKINTANMQQNSTGTTIKSNVTSSIVGISDTGQLRISQDGGFTWKSQPHTSSITGYIQTGSDYIVKNIQTISPGSSCTYILANDYNISSSIASNTYIFKTTSNNKKIEKIYSSSLYTLNKLDYLNCNILYGIDSTNGYVLKSLTGGRTWATGSIASFSGNTVKNINIASETNGFLVGSKIWYIQSGSTLNWVTSSYSGSHILNDIDSFNFESWIAVGESGSIYKTLNSGDTWTQVTQSITTQSLNAVKILANGNVLAVGNLGTILLSSTTGSTWYTASYDTPYDFADYNYTSISDYSTSELALNSSAGQVKSNTAGNRWSSFNSNINIVNASANEFKSKLLTNPRGARGLPYLSNTALVTPPSDYIVENVAIGAYSIASYKNAWGLVGVGAKTFEKITPAINNIQANYGEIILESGSKIFFDFIEDTNMPPRPSNYGQVAIGRLSQGNAINSSFNTSVGYGSLYLSENSNYNTAIGFYSQHLSTNNRNTSLGMWALGINGDISVFNVSSSYSGGDDNIAIGYKALMHNINSKRGTQIVNAGFPNASSIFSALGSRNVAIGNRSLNNSSGSTNAVAIGHYAVIDSYDLTDSVFIGGYVGYRFKTLAGTYYSSSVNNDWKPTQTVAVGSYSLLNHTGTDIVAVGANALRGVSNTAFPNFTGVTSVSGSSTSVKRSSAGIIITGLGSGNTYSQLDLPTDMNKPFPPRFNNWQTDLYEPKKPGERYHILDVLKGASGASPNDINRQYRLWDVDIVDERVAYAVYSSEHSNPYAEEIADGSVTWLFNTDGGKQFFRLLRADNLTKNQPIKWKTIQHIGMPDSNRHNKLTEGVVHKLNRYGTAHGLRISAPDINTVYVLNKESNNICSIFKSIDGGRSFHSDTPGQVPEPLNFRTLIGTSAVYFQTLHFPTTSSGTVVGSRVGFPYYVKTTDGGFNWTHGYVDSTDSGSNVELYSVWFDESHGTGYVGGDWGSIYKTTNSGSSWTKLIGGSSKSNVAGLVYTSDSAFNSLAKTSKNLPIRDIFFINASVGWAVLGPLPIGDAADYNNVSGQIGGWVLRTTDGGTTWNKTQLTHLQCPSLFGKPIPNRVRAFDANTVFVSTDAGLVHISTDGGVTFGKTGNLTRLIAPNDPGCCDSGMLEVLDVFPLTNPAGTGSITYETDDGTSTAFETVTVGADAQVAQTLVQNSVAVGYKVQYDASGSSINSVQIGSKSTLNTNYILDTVAVGKETLSKTRYIDKTTAVGTQALQNVQGSSTFEQFITPLANGRVSEFDVVTKTDYNTALGYRAGMSLLQGDRNVFLGANSGGDPLFPITIGNNNIVIGANARKTFFNTTNQVTIGNDEHTTYIARGVPQVAGWIWQSDSRDKTDTGSFTLGLEFIRQLQPKEFKWDPRTSYASGSTPNGTHKQSGSSYGYLAQDLESAATAVGVSGSLFVFGASGSYSGSTNPSGSDFEVKLIVPSMVNIVAVNAIKQLDTTVSFLTASKYVANIGDGVNISLGVTHSLNTRDIIASVHSNVTSYVAYPTMSIDSVNTMTITFNTIPSSNEYRLIVMR